MNSTTPIASVQTPDAESYEARVHPVVRRMSRVVRAARSAAARLSRRPIDVLVEIRWRLGDEVMALPIYETLKAKHAPCRLHVWCNYPDLLVDHPHVDTINVPSVNPHRYLLLRGARRDAYRLAEYARRAGVTPPHARPALCYVDWNAPILAELPAGDGPLVAVTTGASWPTKRWNGESWRRLCSTLLQRGARLIEVGQGNSPIGIGASLLNRSTVREAATVLHAADLLISPDSGLMHLALAAGTPVLALFGPTDPSILIRGDERLHSLTNRRECQGCWNISQRMQTPGVCPLGVSDCLATISPDDVATQALRLLYGE